jgi:hypothetical protein
MPTVDQRVTHIEDFLEGKTPKPFKRLGDPVEPPPADEYEWKHLADRNVNFRLEVASKVRWGVDTRWVERDLPAGSHNVNGNTNGFFGRDPAEGVIKTVQVWAKKSEGGGTVDPPPVDPDPTDPEPIVDPQPLSFTRDPNNVKGAHRGISENIGTSAQNPKNFYSKGTEVYRTLFDLSQFRNTPISDRMLDHMGQYLSQMISAGVTANFSAFYWWGSSADALRAWQNKEPTEASFELMLRHVEQLQPLWERYPAAINFIAALLVGKWAEWNKSFAQMGIEDNTDEARRKRRALVDLVMQALPKELMFGFRYPGHYRERYGTKVLGWDEAYGTSDQARTGGFYDYAFADYAKDRWGSIADITRFTHYGGEGVPSSYNEARARDARAEFAATHWHHMQPMFRSEFERFGIYEELMRRMSYRYVLKSGALPKTVRGSDKLRLDLVVENEGFASLHKKKDIDIVLRNRSSGTVIRAKANEGKETDARRILPRSGQTKTIKLSAPLQAVPAGSYDVALHVKDIYAITANRPEFSIRFANTNTWDSATGHNKLGSLVVN